MQTTRITPHNLYDFPVGTLIEFHWGLPESTGGDDFDGPTETVGMVVDHAHIPHAMWPKTHLVVETPSGQQHTVSMLSDRGIGARLLPEVREITEEMIPFIIAEGPDGWRERGAVLTVEGGYYVMRGASGEHKLWIDGTDMERLNAHWRGFARHKLNL